MSADEELDRLLAAPLPSFVEERKRLAEALKAAGRKDDAKAIAKINKPSLPVWVINQLAHQKGDGKLLTRLGVLSDELRDVPAGTAASGYGQLVGEHRELLKTLRAAAEKILGAAAHDTGPALLERIVHSLRAGMADPVTRAAIERGRLLQEIGEVDFTSMVGAGGPVGPVPAQARTEPSAPAREPTVHPGKTTVPDLRLVPARATAAGAAESARDAERASIAAERDRTRARAAAERELERARTQLTAARRRVAEEQRALESARHVLEAANRALESARRTLDEKEERTDGARRDEGLATRTVEAAEAALAALG